MILESAAVVVYKGVCMMEDFYVGRVGEVNISFVREGVVEEMLVCGDEDTCFLFWDVRKKLKNILKIFMRFI